MNNKLKLILFIFFLSKIPLEKSLTILDLLRTNSQCSAIDHCEACSSTTECDTCSDGYEKYNKKCYRTGNSFSTYLSIHTF